jgi:hypothetical protein
MSRIHFDKARLNNLYESFEAGLGESGEDVLELMR